jgi:membrane associated rhomboid family serine protease
MPAPLLEGDTLFVLPINRDSDVANTPRAVIALIAINCVVFLAMVLSPSPASIVRQYGFTPAHAQILTLFTSMFLHGGWLHLLGNMWFLWMFGKDVENSMGMWLFTLVYLVCGVGGGLLHFALNLKSAVPCVGASGAISGVMGCFFVLFPKAEFDLAIYFGWFRITKIQTRTAAAVGAWIGEQALLGLITQAVRISSVAFWAHVGGFAVGILAGFCFKSAIQLDSEGVPVVRPWFIPAQEYKERNDITQLKL